MKPVPSSHPLEMPKGEGDIFQLRRKGYRVWAYHLFNKVFLRCYTILESTCGPRALGWLAVLFLAYEMPRRRKEFPRFVQLHNLRPPEFWKGTTPLRHYVLMVWRYLLMGGTTMAYPRLGRPYWQKRFKVHGTPPQALPEWSSRPVVLAFLHIGAYGLIPFWLRSQGIAAGCVMGGIPGMIDNTEFNRLRDQGDRLHGLEGVPLIFKRRGPAVRDAFRFLTPKHILVMALDGGRVSAEHDVYDGGGFTFYAHQGAARLATSTNAILMPVAMHCTGYFRFEVRYGKPVPDELLRAEDYKSATQYLVTQLWDDIREFPSDLTWTSMESCAPELRGYRVGWP